MPETNPAPPPKTGSGEWAPTEHPNETIVPGKMRSDREKIPDGYTKADADKAETMEARIEKQRMLRVAPGCQVYWPAPYEVCGAIRDKYNSLGGPRSFLLLPKSNELTNPDRVGKRTEFQNGPIYWSPQGGAHPVVNHFFAAWARQGWEGGHIGYPTTDEIVNPDKIGRRQHFTGSTIYWNARNPIHAYAIGGRIFGKWGETGWEQGFLGYPTSDETGTPDGVGRFNQFERGMMYWTFPTDAHPVAGGILAYWAFIGYEKSPWGYPVSDQYDDEKGLPTQAFQNEVVDLTSEVKAADPDYKWYAPGQEWVVRDKVGEFKGTRPTKEWDTKRFIWTFHLSDFMINKGVNGLNTRMGCVTWLNRNGELQTWYNDRSHTNEAITYQYHGSIPNNEEYDKYQLLGMCQFTNDTVRKKPNGTIAYGVTLAQFGHAYQFIKSEGE
ncbi:LGFP repeat-containing protein [Nocardia sp. NPDC051570]|uniref:LGFP repeat-containing protein n=1 Tax=Nocardia sp. NPDC051570 TaxID=3364324 RepID=UPI0037A6EB07